MTLVLLLVVLASCVRQFWGGLSASRKLGIFKYMSSKVALLVPSQETPPSCRLGGRVRRRPEDWAPMDRCAGQFDNKALHVNFCQPLAVSEPPTESMTVTKLPSVETYRV